MGLAELDDHGAGGTNVGLAFVPQNSSPINRTRSGSRAAYYDPIASRRSNLHLLVRHYVSRVQFHRKKAIGVHVHSRNVSESAPYLLKAKKEVILAAGAIRTPSILQHSGVGPRSILEPLGIDVIEDLPGVGRNFQDHPWVLLLYSCMSTEEGCVRRQSTITDNLFQI
jgi:choline dehydrogenase-like flavoprotein